MKLIIQIPCYNEEATLPQVLADLPRQIDGIDTIETLLIDDGSTDRTVETARRLGVHHILPLGTNRGLAFAFLKGLHYAVRLGADIIVNTDGDNQYDGRCIPDLIRPILEGRLDIVIGARPIKTIEHFSWSKKKLQQLGSRIVRQFSGTDIPDTTSGFRAYSAEAAMKLHVFNRYTYTLETIIQAGHMDLRIGSVPIRVNPQTRPSRLISSTPAYIARSASIILRSYITYKPLRTFFYASIVPGTLGLALCIRYLYFFFTGSGRGHLQSLLLAAILLILTFLLWVLGILADLISVNRKLIQEQLYLSRNQERTGRRMD
ncbi:MAG TPA: glycosyltransferase family 2 protein [Anaerohalosphaeraceae bacterium]|nr:glycosyltransferase family 2 protein [Anaerohalosphaeraceae bacterium]HOL89610.1 glycosyltransferase family 2 protein [Anaerohalosphaeraceae bacterium]HPP55074.1 glycosyltransferase family 2 protein [Anaerohalosphaeraceae bacterium]